ncbi:hypothetical protein [Terriglobus roseus]|nr:hypothetical protein [Terriglobus roseus]
MAVLLITLLPSSVLALRFDTHVAPSGARVLVVRDCGGMTDQNPTFKAEDKSKACNASESSFTARGKQEDGTFYEGDEVLLDRLLAQAERANKPYQEVWLFSGGGDVDAGVGIARSLRNHRATVRVPANYRCVSSCTLAFMGGLFRYVDDGGKYEVHSASSWLQPEGSDRHRLLQAVAKDPEEGLPALAENIRISARYQAIRFFYLFENTLLLMTKHEQFKEDDAVFRSWAEGNLPPLAYAQKGSRELQTDIARVKSEGVGGLQDILMRLEREQTLEAIPAIRATLPSDLPYREAAFQMIRSMYQTSIKETSLMNRVTMLKQGYITADFDKP